MQKWEYCFLNVEAGTIMMFTHDGAEYTELAKMYQTKNPEWFSNDEPPEWTCTVMAIARLGLEGWELVGQFGELFPLVRKPTLWFKRPI